MEDRSEISYWFKDENILTVPTRKVPENGERIHIDNRMSKVWHDANFSKPDLFVKGVNGWFSVKSVKRFYKSFDYIHKEGGRKFPSQQSVEIFEIQLESEEEG